MRRLVAAMCGAFLNAFVGSAWAQTPVSTPPPPMHRDVDINSVDLLSGAYVTNATMVAIGQKGAARLSRIYYNTNSWDNFTGAINSSGSNYTVSIADRSEIFTLSGGIFVNAQGGGSTLTLSGSTYTYTAADGTVGLFSTSWAGTYPTQANVARITSLTKASGEALTYWYETVNLASSGTAIYGQRLQSVTNNFGYQIKYSYVGNSGFQAEIINTIIGINNAVDYCNPSADSCSGFTVSWPTATYTLANPSGVGAYTWTDPMGLTTSYMPTSVQTPGGMQLTLAYNASNQISSISSSFGTFTYTYLDTNGVRTTTVTDPVMHTRVVTSNIANQTVLSDTDGNGHKTTYTYDSYNRPSTITYPRGNSTTFTYDPRGNVTQVTRAPATGSSLANIITHAAFDPTCSLPVKCNKPNSTTDALGNETDYTYNTTYGVLLSVTAPAPTSGAVRPQIRYIYNGQSAYYKNSAGSLVAGPPVHILAFTSQCATTASCDGTSDEVEGYIVRGSTGVANNLAPTAVTTYAGDNSLYATTTITYDNFGNVYTKTSPLGAPYTTRYRYDADHRVVGVVGPDPDGSGPLANRAIRYDYSASTGLLNDIEKGTVPSQSDSDWTNFASLTGVAYTYDALENKASQSIVSGSTIYTEQQFAHDVYGNLGCQTIRLATSTAPAACGTTPPTLSSDGPDRTEQMMYDGANQLITDSSGYNTTPSYYRSLNYTYTENGTVATAADEKNNLTTYDADGFDRLHVKYYPSPTTPGVSSTTDDEIFTYDANSHPVSIQRRNGAVISIAYDNDGRPTNDVNGATVTYDNLNRVTSRTLAGVTDSYTYDALSRVTAQGQPRGSVQIQYDLDNRRTQLTWPDGYYVTYAYDYADDLTGLGENGPASGSTLIATLGYDNLGRQTSITRPNNISTAYGYDGASRLSNLSHTGSTNSGDVSFTYGYNAASELTTRSSSNSNYDWTAAATALTYASNGLNQLTSAGPVAPSYDALGDLTADGTHSYSYNSLGQLTATGSATFGYDPAGRLGSIADASPVNFLYDGQTVIAEYNSANQVLRRFTFVGVDAPLYYVDATTDTQRGWLLADERGSIIGTSNSSGQVAFQTYDAYGKPAATNASLFQYEGQIWLADAGAYSFKARNYHPGLGRFMQIDPIGWAGGANLYRFAVNDPVNGSDVSGLTTRTTPVVDYDDDGLTPSPFTDSSGSAGDDCSTAQCIQVTGHPVPVVLIPEPLIIGDIPQPLIYNDPTTSPPGQRPTLPQPLPACTVSQRADATTDVLNSLAGGSQLAAIATVEFPPVAAFFEGTAGGFKGAAAVSTLVSVGANLASNNYAGAAQSVGNYFAGNAFSSSFAQQYQQAGMDARSAAVAADIQGDGMTRTVSTSCHF